MFPRLIAAGVLALALSGFAADQASAAALSGACLWVNLAPSKQASLMADYRARGMESLQNVVFADSDVAALPEKCGVTGENANLAGEIIGATLLEQGATAILSEQFRITPKQITQAWNGLGAPVQIRLRAFAKAVMSEQPPVEADFTGAMDQMAATLGVTDDGGRRQIAAYILGRSLREMRELQL